MCPSQSRCPGTGRCARWWSWLSILHSSSKRLSCPLDLHRECSGSSFQHSTDPRLVVHFNDHRIGTSTEFQACFTTSEQSVLWYNLAIEFGHNPCEASREEYLPTTYPTGMLCGCACMLCSCLDSFWWPASTSFTLYYCHSSHWGVSGDRRYIYPWGNWYCLQMFFIISLNG